MENQVMIYSEDDVEELLENIGAESRNTNGRKRVELNYAELRLLLTIQHKEVLDKIKQET